MPLGEGKLRGVLLVAGASAIAVVLWAHAQAPGQRTAEELRSEPPESSEPASAVPTATATGIGEIAGVVTEAATGKPVSGARVMGGWRRY